MKLHYTLSGGQALLKPFPLYGAGADIKEGACVIKGATPGTDQGFGILAALTYAGVLGVLTSHHENSSAGADSKQDGTAYTRLKVIINPDAVYLAEHVAPATAALAIATVGAATAGATITVSSIEDNIDGSWIWASDGQLQYVTGSTSSNFVIKSANAWVAGTTTFAKIKHLYSILSDLDATECKIQNPVAAPTGKIITLENYVSYPGGRIEALDPTKHSGTVALPASGGKVFSDILFQVHAFANIG